MTLPIRRKRRNENRTVTFDFTEKLGAGDTLTGSATILTDPGISASGTSVASPTVSTRLSGGISGQSYGVVCRISTTLGDTLELEAMLEVQDGDN